MILCAVILAGVLALAGIIGGLRDWEAVLVPNIDMTFGAWLAHLAALVLALLVWASERFARARWPRCRWCGERCPPHEIHWCRPEAK